MIDTKTIKTRVIQFASISQVRTEVERLMAADRTRGLITSGNWTPGQIFGHLAAWMNYSYDGYPAALRRPNWFIRVTLRVLKSKMLRDPLPKGFRIPGMPEGTLATERLETQVAGHQLLAALARLEGNVPTVPSPVFGRLTHSEVIQLQLRHCEAHLAFIDVKS